MLLYRIPWLVSLRFAGALGADELAAAALASTLCNVTGLSLSVGLSSALTTLAGQARGHLFRARQLSESSIQKKRAISMSQSTGTVSSFSENEGDTDFEDANVPENRSDTALNLTSSAKEVMPLVFLYRGMFIQLLFVVPVGLWWLVGIEPLLLALGQGPELSHMTQNYLRILTPGLWSYSINWTLASWLQTMEMSDVPAYAAGCGLLVHVPLNYLFINVMGWGYLGVAVATVSFQIIQPGVMITYIMSQGGSKRLWRQMGAADHVSVQFWSMLKVAVSKGIRQYLGLALPGIVIISEWWASEIAIFLSGRLDNPSISLAAMSVYQSINSFCFMFPTGIAIAGATRVSTWLGAGNATSASKASAINISSAGCVSAVLGTILYMTPQTFFPSLFAPSQVELYNQAGELMPLLAFYVFADGITSAFNGTIKGCGKQALIMPVVVIAYWFVGLPLAYHWAFNDECSTLCGDVGLVTGMLTGTWTHMLLLAVLVIFGTNWPLEAEKAHARMMAEKEEND
jgi:MATE family multidrug resistance protein